MTRAQLESAEQRMQQQWHDLVMAEQAGKPLEVLEQMYDSYILLAEEYNEMKSTYDHRRARAKQRPKLAGAHVLKDAPASKLGAKRSA